MTCCLNIGYLVLPILTGGIHDYTLKTDYGYFWVGIFYLFLMLLSLLTWICMIYYSHNYFDDILNKKIVIDEI